MTTAVDNSEALHIVVSRVEGVIKKKINPEEEVKQEVKKETNSLPPSKINTAIPYFKLGSKVKLHRDIVKNIDDTKLIWTVDVIYASKNNNIRYKIYRIEKGMKIVHYAEEDNLIEVYGKKE